MPTGVFQRRPILELRRPCVSARAQVYAARASVAVCMCTQACSCVLVSATCLCEARAHTTIEVGRIRSPVTFICDDYIQ